MAMTPEAQQILDQVQSELEAFLLAGEVGTITVHCGRGDLSVEVMRKRKHEPVRIEQGKHLAVIAKAR